LWRVRTGVSNSNAHSSEIKCLQVFLVLTFTYASNQFLFPIVLSH
jgi:hypothetical protein